MGVARNAIALAFGAALTLLVAGCGANGGAPAGAIGSATSPPMPLIGLSLDTVEIDPALGQGQTSGGRVEFTPPGSPADSAGVREGDIVLSVNHRPVSSNEELVAVIKESSVGAVVPVSLIRDGGRQTVDVKLAERPANYVSPGGPLNQAYIARIQHEQQAAADAEKAGDYRAAFGHYITAMGVLHLHQQLGADIRQLWTNDVARLAAILPKLKPRPSVPHEADRHNQRAIILLQRASRDDDYDHAAREFTAALYEAPWIADIHLNLGLTMAKAGFPESALLDLRDYLILNPNAHDAASVNQKITELELLAEERKPWLPLMGVKTTPDGAALLVMLRDRKLEVTVSNNLGANQKARVGEPILSGTIHGRQFQGKMFLRPYEPNLTVRSSSPESSARCFGAEQQQEARGGVVTEADGTYLRWQHKSFTYHEDTCVLGENELWTDGAPIMYRPPR